MNITKLDEEQAWIDQEKEIQKLADELYGTSTKAGFNPNQQRNPDGTWGGGEWHKIDLKQQVDGHFKYGGSTYDPKTGKDWAGAKGMASVALFKERSSIGNINDLTPEKLNAFIEKNKDILNAKKGKFAVGTWWGSEDGKPKQLWLDVAFVTTLKEAIELGRETGQVAVFDLEKLEDVPTGGTGKYNVMVMDVKRGNKKKFDKFGKYLLANRNTPKLTDEEIQKLIAKYSK